MVRLACSTFLNKPGEPITSKRLSTPLKELRRSDKTLDRIELRAFDHARRCAELAAGIEFGFDTAFAAGLDQAAENLHPLVLGVVQGLRAQLHHDRCLRIDAA